MFSRHLRQDSLPEKMALADLETIVAEDVVSGGHVEEEVRERVHKEILLGIHRPLAAARHQGHIPVFRPNEGGWIDPSDECARAAEPCLELVDGRLDVWKTRD